VFGSQRKDGLGPVFFGLFAIGGWTRGGTGRRTTKKGGGPPPGSDFVCFGRAVRNGGRRFCTVLRLLSANKSFLRLAKPAFHGPDGCNGLLFTKGEHARRPTLLGPPDPTRGGKPRISHSVPPGGGPVLPRQTRRFPLLNGFIPGGATGPKGGGRNKLFSLRGGLSGPHVGAQGKPVFGQPGCSKTLPPGPLFFYGGTKPGDQQRGRGPGPTRFRPFLTVPKPGGVWGFFLLVLLVVLFYASDSFSGKNPGALSDMGA